MRSLHAKDISPTKIDCKNVSDCGKGVKNKRQVQQQCNMFETRCSGLEHAQNTGCFNSAREQTKEWQILQMWDGSRPVYDQDLDTVHLLKDLDVLFAA